MSGYLELTEDEMVDTLAEFQRLCRTMFAEAKDGQGEETYDKSAHERATMALLMKCRWLASQGDVV